MQYEITDDAAKEFGRAFYEAIADGSPVDIAVAEARKSLSIQMSSTLEWGTPVLFMRTDDGVLFRMHRSKAAAGGAARGTGDRVDPPAAVGTDAGRPRARHRWRGRAAAAPVGAIVAPITAGPVAGAAAAPAPDGLTSGAAVAAADTPDAAAVAAGVADGPAGTPAAEAASVPAAAATPPPVAASIAAEPRVAADFQPGVASAIEGSAHVPDAAAISAPIPASATKPILNARPRSIAVVGIISVGVLLGGGLLVSRLLGGGGEVSPSGSPGSAPSTAIAGGAGATKGTIDIALELMPSKSVASVGIANGVKLAVSEAGGVAGGWKVEIPDSAVLDDGGDVQRGKDNMQAIVGQDRVVAVIGPQQSGIASGQIPISNAAGLLQCSPSAASDGLTKPDAGALKLRSSQPDKVNFVRTVSTNSADAPATAKFILENLRRSNVYVVDNKVSTAQQRATLFSKYFNGHGGTVVGQGSLAKKATDAELAAVVADVTAKRPDVLFFSGSSGSSEIVARFFKATRAEFGAVPFVASGEIKADTTFRDLAGADLTTNVFTSLAAAEDFPGNTAFNARYQTAFGVAPGTYSATAHACAAVVLDAIARAGDSADLVRPSGARSGGGCRPIGHPHERDRRLQVR